MSLPRHSENKSKLAILGLANAGKTSILKTILYEFKAFANLLPTTMVERTEFEFFGKSLIVWDFGGQADYREIYLTRPVMYFQGIKFLYYVLDAQDPDQLGKSIEYFKEILQKANEFSDNIRVFLFFHKIDPNYKGKIDFAKIETEFIEAMSDDFAKYKITPAAFHTSIYSPMSVISAFAQPLLGNQTIYNTLCDVVDSFCWERDLPFGFIFVNNLEIGSYYSSNIVQNYVQKRMKKYLLWLDDTEDISKFEMGDYDIITKPFEISVGDNDFEFIFSVGVDQLFEPDDINDIFEDMDDFIQDLEKILPNSEIIRTGELRIDEIFDEEFLEEIQQNEELLEEISELEEDDKQLEFQRIRELSQLDEQYQNMDPSLHNYPEDEDTYNKQNYDDLDEIENFEDYNEESEDEIDEDDDEEYI